MQNAALFDIVSFSLAPQRDARLTVLVQGELARALGFELIVDSLHTRRLIGDHDDHGLLGPVVSLLITFVVWVALVLLSIPSLFIGAVSIGTMLFGDYFKGVVFLYVDH